MTKRRRKNDDDPAPPMTQAMENYLLSIYLVKEEGLPVTNVNLVKQLRRVPETEGLGTSLPSVSGMLRRMERERLIRIGEKRDIKLTDSGTLLAEKMITRHRLAGLMIVDFLGVELWKVNAQAHMLEHAISDYMEERIRLKFNNPKVDPFGQPIPGSGYVQPKGVSSLENSPVGKPLIIDRIPEDDVDLVKYLVQNNIKPGLTIVVQEIAPYRGVVSLQGNDGPIVLGYDLANRIKVRNP